MVVVRGLLHQINPGPHHGINKDAYPVFVTKHHHNAKKTHNGIIPDHSVTGQGLQKIKSNKIKCKLRLY